MVVIDVLTEVLTDVLNKKLLINFRFVILFFYLYSLKTFKKMSSRASGYRYVRDASGNRRRIYGRGAYYQGRSVSRAYAARSLSGRGWYGQKFLKKIVPKGSFSAVGKYLGNLAGTAYGGPSLGAAGGIVGSAAGSGLAKLLGFGAYKVSSNSFMGEGQDPASMHSVNNAVKVRHREYITDISSSATANTFSNQSFSLNPGLPTVFPWLSAIAAQYQEFKPLGVVFEFKTLSSTAIASSTNTTIGGIIMSTDYNSINPQFPNKASMDNAEYTTSAPVYDSFYHPIECDMKQNPLSTLYIRSGAVPANTDQRMYDLGQFQIASFGVQGTSVVLGELWVSYEFEFSKPISVSALGQDVLTDHFRLGGVVNAKPLGTSSTIQANSSIGGTINAGGTTYSFNPLIQEGNYLVSYTVTGNSTACTAPSLTPTNCTLLQVWQADDGTAVNNGTNTVTTWLEVFAVTITALNATIAWGASGTLPAAFSSGDLWITQIDSNITT